MKKNKNENENRYGEILETLLRTIARADNEFQGQIRRMIGCSKEEFDDFLDNAEFPIVGTRDRHGV